MPAKGSRLLFIVNDAAFFVSHRMPIALAAQSAGYEVYVAAPHGPGTGEIETSSITYLPLSLVRASTNPLRELVGIAAMRKIIAHVKPDVMHLITMKPVIYGGIAARTLGVPLTVAAISGLGFTFIAQGTRASLLRQGLFAAFRLALGNRRTRVIFQNSDDRDLFLAHGLVDKTQVRMIAGSGTNLSAFTPEVEPEGPLCILLPARMLWDKGVKEFVEAAQILRKQGHEFRFVLSGNTDENPAAVPQATLDGWHKDGVVEWLPHTKQIGERLAACHIVVLPSYREGFPKSLIDAAAAGRPVVTTDVPGCRDAIISGETGLLIPARDSQSLAKAILTLTNPVLRLKMGKAGRALAEARYSIEGVITKHLDIYSTRP